MEITEAHIINFEKICRLCLHEKQSLTEIFDSTTEEDYLTLDRKIMACASIEVSKNDGFPPRICVKCLSNVNAAFNFRILCENSDKTLNDIYNLLKENKRISAEVEPNIYKVNIKEQNEFQDVKQTIEDISHVIFIRNEEDKTPVDSVDDMFYLYNEDDSIEERIEKENFEDGASDSEDKERYFTSNNSSYPKISQDKDEKADLIMEGEMSFPTQTQNEKPQQLMVTDLENKEGIGVQESKVKDEEKILGDTRKLPCPYCNKKLTRIDEHIRLLHRNRIYKCIKFGCGAEFLTLKNLQSHQLNCYDMKKAYKCSRCLKEFHRKSNFKAHIRRHTNRKDFQCQLCDCAFVDSTGLRRHFLKHHEPEQEVFISGCCGKKFKSKEGLKKHIRRRICGIQIFQVVE